VSQGITISAYVPTHLIGVPEPQPTTRPETRRVPQEANHPMTDRNRGVHIPLDFETAVEGLLNVKPKRKRPEK
jgi:hypothetical protein